MSDFDNFLGIDYSGANNIGGVPEIILSNTPNSHDRL